MKIVSRAAMFKTLTLEKHSFAQE